jgi:hypothetical protein
MTDGARPTRPPRHLPKATPAWLRDLLFDLDEAMEALQRPTTITFATDADEEAWRAPARPAPQQELRRLLFIEGPS